MSAGKVEYNLDLLTSAEKMWNISNREVSRALVEVVPGMKRVAWNWLNSYSLFAQVNTARQEEYLRLAFLEAGELVEAVIGEESEENQKLEYGDVWSYLLFQEKDLDFDLGFLEMIEFGEEPLDWIKELPGELAVFTAAMQLNDSWQRAETLDKSGLKVEGGLEAVEVILLRTFSILIRYGLARGWDLRKVIEETMDKNVKKMPIALFRVVSPFTDYAVAHLCAEILRRYSYSKDTNINDEIDEYMGENQLWMISGHSDVVHFRKWVFNHLMAVRENDGFDDDGRYMADYLLDLGQWDDQPLSLA